MEKKVILILFTILISFGLLGLSMAAEKGNSRKGRFLFRNNCRACHNGKKAQDLDPVQKKTKEWEAVFAKDKYKEYKCKSEWGKLSAQDLIDMLQYLCEGAADSKVPRGCG